MDIHDQLISSGWIYKGNCNCGGRHTDKYEFKNEIGKFELKITSKFFLFKKPNYKFKRFSINLIDKILNETIQKENKDQGNA